MIDLAWRNIAETSAHKHAFSIQHPQSIKRLADCPKAHVRAGRVDVVVIDRSRLLNFGTRLDFF